MGWDDILNNIPDPVARMEIMESEHVELSAVRQMTHIAPSKLMMIQKDAIVAEVLDIAAIVLDPVDSTNLGFGTLILYDDIVVRSAPNMKARVESSVRIVA
jgi:hypothetical protein